MIQREADGGFEDLPEDIVLPDGFEITQADKTEIGIADGDIGETEGDGQQKREADQQQDVEQRRRQEKQYADEAPIVERKGRQRQARHQSASAGFCIAMRKPLRRSKNLISLW